MISNIFCNTCVEVLFNMNNVSVNDWLTECYKCMIAKLKYESTTKNKKSDALIPVCENRELTITKCVENGTK